MVNATQEYVAVELRTTLMLSLGGQLGRAGTGKSTPAENMGLASYARRWGLNTDYVHQDTRKPMEWLNVSMAESAKCWPPTALSLARI